MGYEFPLENETYTVEDVFAEVSHPIHEDVFLIGWLFGLITGGLGSLFGAILGKTFGGILGGTAVTEEEKMVEHFNHSQIIYK